MVVLLLKVEEISSGINDSFGLSSSAVTSKVVRRRRWPAPSPPFFSQPKSVMCVCVCVEASLPSLGGSPDLTTALSF